MRAYLWVLVAFLAVAALAMAPDVYAQWNGSGGMGGGMGAGRGGPPSGNRSGERQRPNCDPGERPNAAEGAPMSREQLEYALGALRVDLHLSAAQAAPWQVFTDQLLAFEADQARLRARAQAPQSVSAKPEGSINPIQRAVDRTRNRLTALEDVETSGSALVQTLNVDQKAVLDLRMATLLAPLLGEGSTRTAAARGWPVDRSGAPG